MKPLTIDELKTLRVGDWVWLEVMGDPFWEQLKTYAQKYSSLLPDEEFSTNCGRFMYLDYETKWIAYKNKEQAEEI